MTDISKKGKYSKLSSLLAKAEASGKELWKKGAAHIFIGNFLTKFVSFFSSIFLIKVLSTESFGILSYYDNLSGYFQVFMGMGLSCAILRYAVLGKTDGEKYSYYRYSMLTGCKFNLALLAVSVVFTLFYQHKPSYQSYKWLLVLMVAIVPAKFLTEGTLNCQRAMFDSKRYAIFSFFISSAWVLSRFLGGLAFGLLGAVVLSFIAEYVISFYMTMHTRRLYFSKSVYCEPVPQTRKEIDLFALQYMLTNSLWAIFMLNDTFLIGRMIDDATVLAQYKVAYVLPANIAIMSASIGIFVGPYFTRHESDGDIGWVKRNWIKTLAACAGLTGAAVLVLFIFAEPVIMLLYGEDYLGSVPVMRVLLIASLFNSGLRYITAHILASMGKVKYNMIVSAVGMLMQISIDIAVIPRFGSIGVACVSVGVYAFMALALSGVFIFKYFLKDTRKAMKQ